MQNFKNMTQPQKIAAALIAVILIAFGFTALVMWQDTEPQANQDNNQSSSSLDYDLPVSFPDSFSQSYPLIR